MTDKTTRRKVLKTVCTASVVGGFASPTTAEGNRTVQVIETGIRYDLPPHENFDSVHVDSRPPFTIDEENERMVVLKTAHPSTKTRLNESENLFDERTVKPGNEISVAPSNQKATALPTELSSRMRAKHLVTLVSSIRHPSVVLKANPNAPVLTVQSEGNIELLPGERIEVEIGPVTVSVRTTRVVGKVTADHVPEHMKAKKREEGSVEMEATPVVEAVNHGELSIVQQEGSE